MRSMLLLGMVVLFVAGCSDLSDSPTDPFQTAPTVQMSHIGASDPDLCGYSCVDESPVLDSSTTPTNSAITVPALPCPQGVWPFYPLIRGWSPRAQAPRYITLQIRPVLSFEM